MHSFVEESIVTASAEPLRAFEGISREIGGIRKLIQEITNAMTEQTLGAQKILISIKSINENTRSVQDASANMKKRSTILKQFPKSRNGLRYNRGY